MINTAADASRSGRDSGDRPYAQTNPKPRKRGRSTFHMLLADYARCRWLNDEPARGHMIILKREAGRQDWLQSQPKTS
jgi:hypothetical protein